MAEQKNQDLDKKARNAMFIVAILNIVTAIAFWFSYKSTDEMLYLIVVIVNILSAVTIVILTQTLMKRKRH